MYDFFTSSCANATVSSALEKMASDVSEFKSVFLSDLLCMAVDRSYF